MQTNEPTVAATTRHPLLKFKPVTYRSYNEWYVRWEATEIVEDRLGLLHALTTNESCWKQEQAVPLLLDVADGYLEPEKLTLPEEAMRQRYGSRDESPKLRRVIAQKALSVLYLKFFRDIKNRNDTYKQWPWV